MSKILYHCPLCANPLQVTEVSCPSCKTLIRGVFENTCPFCQLSDEHRRFLEVFLQCRGVLQEVGKALGISYPTVRARLDALLETLGYTSPPPPPEAPRLEPSEPLAILQDLEQGRITVAEALRLLRGEKSNNPPSGKTQ